MATGAKLICVTRASALTMANTIVGSLSGASECYGEANAFVVAWSDDLWSLAEKAMMPSALLHSNAMTDTSWGLA